VGQPSESKSKEFIVDPPATAGGTDLLQLQLLTFEAKSLARITSDPTRPRCGTDPIQVRLMIPAGRKILE